MAEEQQEGVQHAEPLRDPGQSGRRQRDRIGVADRADAGAPGQRGLRVFRRERRGRRRQRQRQTGSFRR